MPTLDFNFKNIDGAGMARAKGAQYANLEAISSWGCMDMDLGLNGKTAVVTGGSDGIGLAAVRAFLAEGANVAFFARHSAHGLTAVDSLAADAARERIHFEPADATDAEAVYAFAEHVHQRFGRIDCWVNNVGASLPKAGLEYSPEEIDRMTAICFKSTVYGCQAAFRYMKATGGSIVNVSSLAARCPTVGRSTLYGPLKAAIVGLGTTFAGEYAAWGIRVNSVLPGFTLTPALQRGFDEAELGRNRAGTLLQRLATPDEIARPIVFLASDAASYITAASLEVSGGRCVSLNPTYSFDMKARLGD